MHAFSGRGRASHTLAMAQCGRRSARPVVAGGPTPAGGWATGGPADRATSACDVGPGRSAQRPSTATGCSTDVVPHRSEEHTSELQSLMRISYAVFCLKQKTSTNNKNHYKT